MRVLLFILILGIALQPSSASFAPYQKLEASDGGNDDYFGDSIALSGDGNTAIVGAGYDTTPRGVNAGSAYIFVRNSNGLWTQQQKLTASDGARYDYFGEAVALSDDGRTAIVGAADAMIGSAREAGAAYIFTRNASGVWSQQQKLFLSYPENRQDVFGASVALSGDGNTAFVGAPAESITAEYGGAVYVFTRNPSNGTWTQLQRLEGSGDQWHDYFGTSMAISTNGNVALIGSLDYKGGVGDGVGSAYMFTRDTNTGSWSLRQKIEIPDSIQHDHFSVGVALNFNGTVALITAPGDDTDQGHNSGVAYIYNGNLETGVWTQEQRLRTLDSLPYDYFGESVALNPQGDVALISAPWRDTAKGMDAGVVYVFERGANGWGQTQVVEPADNKASNYLGDAMAFSRRTLMLGAPYQTTSRGRNAGAIYFMELNIANPELANNGGFEPSMDGWVVSNETRDKRRCNVTIARSGSCAFRFKGVANENAVLTQTLYATQIGDLQSGDVLNMSMWYRTNGVKPRVTASLTVNYNQNGTIVSDTPVQVALDTSKGVYREQSFPAYTMRENFGVPVSINLTFHSRSGKSKIIIDDVRLSFTPRALTPLQLE